MTVIYRKSKPKGTHRRYTISVDGQPHGSYYWSLAKARAKHEPGFPISGSNTGSGLSILDLNTQKLQKNKLKNDFFEEDDEGFNWEEAENRDLRIKHFA